MNGHFVYPPPPGVVFLPHGHNYPPAQFVPPQPSQYAPHSPSLPSPSQNGAYPLYPYLPPYMNPLAPPFSPSLPPHPHPPHFPPPGLYHLNQNLSGSAYPSPQYPQQPTALNGHHNFPEHPPGLPIPHRSFSSLAVSEGSPSRDHIEIHEYWKGRLAPLPGYRSQPVLLPMTDPEVLQEAKPEENEQKPAKKLELLPPMSFYGKNHVESSASTQTPEESKNNQKNEKINKAFQMDKYADSFVPEYLKKIQHEQHSLIPLPALPIFPSTSYLNSFLPSSRSENIQKSYSLHALLSSPPIASSARLSPLELETYEQHWVDILRWELKAMTLEKEGIVLWKKSVKVVEWESAEFCLEVQGIRENHPYLEIGDLVHMREVLEAEKRGRLQAVEGRVVALRKRDGFVHISSEPLKHHIGAYVRSTRIKHGRYIFGPEDDIPLRFNLTFMMNARPLCSMQCAVATVAKLLSSEDGKAMNLARRWIFPDPQDFLESNPWKVENAEIKESQWMDAGLNAEQRSAVSAVALYESPIPHLISGPPGTGKTRTLVEAVLQIFRVQPEACILVCAPSNPAADTLAIRMKDRLMQNEMLRLNNPHRTFAEVPDSIKPYCYVENNVFSIPPWKKLMEYRVIVCSCLDASILVRAQCANTALMAMEEEFVSALHPHRKANRVVQPHWTHLLIDEAAQGSEPELLIPISVVLPRPYKDDIVERTFMPQLTLCGDINQLGPLISSDEARTAEFEMSLLERLFDRPLYAKFEELLPQISGRKANAISHYLQPYTRLVKNYRSHRAILMPPSAIFYKDTLEPCATNGVLNWSGLANSRIPLKFIGHESDEDTNDHDRRVSWFNKGEVDIVVQVVKSLLDEAQTSIPPLRPEEIGIMAPWREQVRLLREELRKADFHAVDVGTVEDYQGRESRVVILSCVRTRPRFLEEDRKKGMGVVLERKRMNVAITRAKELLVVVGSGDLLSRDPYWKGFLQFALRHNLYEGPGLPFEKDGDFISKLESKYLLSQQDGLNAEDRGAIVAGVVAREVLKD